MEQPILLSKDRTLAIRLHDIPIRTDVAHVEQADKISACLVYGVTSSSSPSWREIATCLFSPSWRGDRDVPFVA